MIFVYFRQIISESIGITVCGLAEAHVLNVAAGTPLIAQLAKEKGIEANILGASTKAVGDKAYGNMLLSFADEDSKDRAVAFLSAIEDIIVEEAE